ncbi:ion transporter [Patescibacteria group bacterium]|nr:ion transporter [Patescibacteria group bacterium]
MNSGNALRNALENPQSRLFIIVNDFLAFLTIASVLALVLETVPSLSEYHAIFKAIEWISVVCFLTEYGARVYIARAKFRYIFSFFGIIDLLAILPSLLALGNFTFLKTTRALRILRLLRMIRLAKVARIEQHHGERSLYIVNIQIYFVAMLIALLLLGTLLYIFEGAGSSAHDIPSGMFWSLLIILGDVPYSEPATEAGKAVMILGRFVGLLLLGLLVGLMSPLLRKVLIGTKREN